MRAPTQQPAATGSPGGERQSRRKASWRGSGPGKRPAPAAGVCAAAAARERAAAGTAGRLSAARAAAERSSAAALPAGGLPVSPLRLPSPLPARCRPGAARRDGAHTGRGAGTSPPEAAAAVCPGTGAGAAPDFSWVSHSNLSSPLPFPFLLLLCSRPPRPCLFRAAPAAERPRAQPPTPGPARAVRGGAGREWPSISRQRSGVWSWQRLCAEGEGGMGPGGAGGGTIGRGRYKKRCGQGRGAMERGGAGPRGRR